MQGYSTTRNWKYLSGSEKPVDSRSAHTLYTCLMRRSKTVLRTPCECGSGFCPRLSCGASCSWTRWTSSHQCSPQGSFVNHTNHLRVLLVTLLRALRPDVGGWVTLSPRYWAGRPSDDDGGRAPYSAVRTVTQVGLPSLPAV